MKNFIWKVCCLGWLLYGSVLCGFAQAKQSTEQQLAAVTADLKTKMLEYNWSLAEAYAEYCKENTKFISWNKMPATFRQIIEFERPAELEPYRLKAEESKKKLNDFLNAHEEYVRLVEENKRAFTDEDKKVNKAAFDVFYRELRKTENEDYIPLYEANQKALCTYRAEVLKYMVNAYRQEQRLMPVSYISYSVLSELLYKGSELELMKSELRILENLQWKLQGIVTREKYGLPPEEEDETIMIK